MSFVGAYSCAVRFYMNSELSIADPLVSFGESGTPWSKRFNDTYFGTENGLQESRHVFLEGCDLPRRWRGKDRFVIGETGFGTGLNFLAVWQLWQRTSTGSQTLHYLSVEGFPLDRDVLRACLKPWSELNPLADMLSNAYPDPQTGMHRLFFDHDRVVLTLLCGPVLPVLRNLDATVNAWFLDGFAPDRNPEMWAKDIFCELARCSHTEVRLATYTVAAHVRDGLEAAGFAVEKRSGTGRKREVLVARLKEKRRSLPVDPWFAPAPVVAGPQPRVAIVGSGLAGAHLAFAFHRRGCPTTVVERHSRIAREASSVPGAVFMPRLNAGEGADSAFFADAWRHAQDLLTSVTRTCDSPPFHQCGVLQIAKDTQNLTRLETIATRRLIPEPMMKIVESNEASRITGIEGTLCGAYFPHGGWVEAQNLCRLLLEGCHVLVDKTVEACVRQNDAWTLLDTDGKCIAAADVVVLANGLAAATIPQVAWLPLIARRGQITRVMRTERSTALGCVVAGEGYVLPAEDGCHWIGATFDHVREEERHVSMPEPTKEADAYNVKLLDDLLPGVFAQASPDLSNAWTGVRCTTRDHLPLAGPVPDYEKYLSGFAEVRHGRRPEAYPQVCYHPGLFVLTGLGARGLVTAPLAAELVASQACGDPLPVLHVITAALHPGRFTIRDLQRLQY